MSRDKWNRIYFRALIKFWFTVYLGIRVSYSWKQGEIKWILVQKYILQGVFFFWCAFAEEISWLMIVKAQLSQLITQQVVGVSSQATHPTSFFANGSFQSRDSHFVRVRSFSSAPSFLDPHLVLLPLIFILILILLVLFLVLDLLLFSICFSSSFSSFYSSITSSSSSSLFQICV